MAVAVVAWLLALGPAAAQSDYARELAALDATASKPVVGYAISADAWRADQLFRRASFTESLADLRATRSAFDALGKSGHVEGAPGWTLACARLALNFHALPEARQALSGIPRESPGGSRAQLAFDLAMQSGRYDEARALAERWSGEDAAPPELCRRAALAAFEGQDEQADSLLARAETQLTAREMRFFAWVAVERGALQFRAGNFAAAGAQYRRAEKAWSGWWRVGQRQAELLAAEGRFAESEALYRQLCATHDRPELEQELGDMLLFQKKTAEAAECYQRALAVYLESVERGEVMYLHHLAALSAEGLPDRAAALRWARADLAARGNAGARVALGWAQSLAGDHLAAAEEGQLCYCT